MKLDKHQCNAIIGIKKHINITIDVFLKCFVEQVKQEQCLLCFKQF